MTTPSDTPGPAVPFGRYLLVERIAQGGMAEVFRAVARGPAGVEKTVALKRILPMLTGSDEFTAMFVDEARIASSLTHVNIAQVFEFGEVDRAYYLTMELVEGADLGRLAEAARRRGLALPPPIVAFMIAEAARGLAYAHDKRGPDGAPLGIVHRDVSPQNLLVSYAGEVKIADFGIAKAINKLHKTESGAVMGKLRYMSPEQVMGEPLDARSDLFALGVVLWELLTGRQLFDGDNPGRVAEQVKTVSAPPPSTVRAVPAELDRICGKLLERGREARYAKANELARDLQRLVSEQAPALGREEVGALVAELVPKKGEPEPPPLDEAAATVEALAPTLASTPGGAAPPVSPTVDERQTEPAPASRARLVYAGALAVVAVSAGVLGHRSIVRHSDGNQPWVAIADAGLVEPTGSADAAPAARVLDAESLRLQSVLQALPQESATRRGVPSEDYLAVLSAVDSTLCSGGAEPQLPPEAKARLEALRLEPEATALARFVLHAGGLPDAVDGPFRAFLRHHPAWSAGPPAWSMAALAVRVEPGRADHWLSLLRENGALHRWRERAPDAPAPAADGPAALCDRALVVERYGALEPGPRAEALRRFLSAAPPEAPVEEGGLRYALIAAERDDAAATLDVRLRLTNTAAEPRALALESLRLDGMAAPPTVDPPAAQLGPGLSREVRLRFSAVPDAVAEAALLRVTPSHAIAAYSELLR